MEKGKHVVGHIKKSGSRSQFPYGSDGRANHYGIENDRMVGRVKTETLFSTGNDEWRTPEAVFERLDNEFHFTLDPCATEENHKCMKYYTKDQDGLNASWGGRLYSAIPLTPKSTNG